MGKQKIEIKKRKLDFNIDMLTLDALLHLNVNTFFYSFISLLLISYNRCI